MTAQKTAVKKYLEKYWSPEKYPKEVGSGGHNGCPEDDAVSVCKQIVSNFYSPDGELNKANLPTYSFDLACDINECERIEQSKVTSVNWRCDCSQYRRLKTDLCHTLASRVYVGSDITSFVDLYNKAGLFCKEKAMEQKKNLSVYCGPDFTK